METYSVVINADMGESFGRYRLGNDEEIMKYVTSANLACGFHGGDPTVMRTTVRLAKKYDVAVGAHPGFQDLRGFGRRMMEITPEELSDDLLYQLGALEAFLKVEGMKMWHLSPHGMLDPLVSNEEKYADAFIKTIREYNPELIIVIEGKSLLYKKAKLAGLRVAAVGYPDLNYDSEGNMVIERVKRLADPAEVAQQAISIIKDHKLRTIDGQKIEWQAEVLCFHGDAPNSVEVLKRVRQEFEKEGINVTRW
jgi:UPF0271 protein